MNEIMQISNARVKSVLIKDADRKRLLLEIVNRISNAKIGKTIENYRSNNLTRVNDVKFRTNLAVLSVKKESDKK